LSKPVVDDLTIAMPLVILPVERTPRKVLKATSLILVLTLVVAFSTSVVVGYFFGGQVTEEAMPAKESKMGGKASIINLAYILVMIFIVTLAIIALVKYGKIGILKLFMTFVIMILIFTFTQTMIILYQAYIFSYLWYMGLHGVEALVPFIVYISWIFVAIFCVLYVFSIIKMKYLNIRNAILILNAIWAAVWLGWTSGMLTPIVILVGLATYDIYSVFRGPLRDLTELLMNTDKKAGEEPYGVIIGLGDIFFYSFAISYAYAVLNIIEVAIVAVALFGGAILTFILLLKYEVRALPALPIPVLSAVGLIVLFLYVI